MTTTTRWTRLVRQLDGSSTRRQFRRYSTLIRVDQAHGGGTAKVVSRGTSRAYGTFLLKMFLAVSPFMVIGAMLMSSANSPGSSLLHLVGLLVVLLGYLLQIIIMSTERYLDNARAVPALLARTIFLIEGYPEKWKDLNHRGLINRHLELIADSYARVPNQLQGGDSHARLFRKWGLEMGTSVRDLKEQVAHPTTSTVVDLLQRLSSDLDVALDGRWSEIPRVAPAKNPHIRSPRQRAAWLALSAILLAGAISILVAYSAKLGAGGPLVVSLVGTLGLMAMSRAGISLEGFTKTKGVFDNLVSNPRAHEDGALELPAVSPRAEGAP
jgi:hypothetical protein